MNEAPGHFSERTNAAPWFPAAFPAHRSPCVPLGGTDNFPWLEFPAGPRDEFPEIRRRPVAGGAAKCERSHKSSESIGARLQAAAVLA